MNVPVSPDPQKVQKTVFKLQEVCGQFDALNSTLDELISHIDEEMRNNPLTIYHLKKNRAKQNA